MSVAEVLASEANDITIVDRHPERLRILQDHLDIRTVLGQASHPDVLKKAGAEDADLILAVTNSDETNLLSSLLAKTAGAHKVVSLVHKFEYLRLVPRVGRETIRILLLSHDLKPWREKNVVRSGTR